MSRSLTGGHESLLSAITMHLRPGWTGVVGANGAGKTTLLKLATGLLAPVSGQIRASEGAVYCPQRTDDVPEDLTALIEDQDGDAWEIKGRLGVGSDWAVRWETLSHAERKRAQIAVALWSKPSILAVDEPTNHLDHAAKQMLEAALRRFAGVGLLVSHDRALLDELCGQCLFVDPPEVALRPGGYTEGALQAAESEDAARREKERATQEMRRLEREANRRGAEASRSDARRSKRNLGKDNDARFKRNRARNTGKDGVAGHHRLLLLPKDGESLHWYPTVEACHTAGVHGNQ